MGAPQRQRAWRISEDDSFTRVVRGVCGALLGMCFATCFWWNCGPVNASVIVLAFAISIIVCVVAAVRCGDSFWRGVLECIPWW
jgi:hypothetical protein